jgi:hypothetical protein
MTYAASVLILKVRDLISDTESPYRWEDDPTMLDWINEGAAAMFENHPEFYYVDSIVTTPPATLTAVSDTLTTTQSGQKILINYTAYRCLARDNEDPETMQQAERFLQAYAMGV